MNWIGLKMKPQRTADAKNAPGIDYASKIGPEHQKDNVDTCLVCGTEIPPGPDFCGEVCEKTAHDSTTTA